MLSRMMLQDPNVLMLDGPTNHLDLESITALNNGLLKFDGPMIVRLPRRAVRRLAREPHPRARARPLLRPRHDLRASTWPTKRASRATASGRWPRSASGEPLLDRCYIRRRAASGVVRALHRKGQSMRLAAWLAAAALMSGLGFGCEEGGSADDGDGPTSDGGAAPQDAAQDAAAGGADASMDGGESQDAAAAGSGAGAGGISGGAAGTTGGTTSPSRCPARNLRNDLLGAFGNINNRVCQVCFDRDLCDAAPFGGPAIECFIDVACHTPHLENAARCLTGALAGEHWHMQPGAPRRAAPTTATS